MSTDPPSLASESAAIGTLVGGNYRLIRLIGQGGMGQVYEAEHLRLPRRAAVKILHAGLGRAAEALERFRREAEIASSLGNPHLVKVFDFGSLPDGSPYMVMEYLEGRDLYRRLQECGGRLAPAEILTWMGQAVEGIEAAHQQGVVHRDLKPENLFIARDAQGNFELKVVDFGLSKIRGVSRSLTGLNTLGTPAYMSPEQILETSGVDHRTDIYALGVTLYQLITGALPFDDEAVMGLMDKVLKQPPPPAHLLAPWVSAELDRVLERSMSKAPADRYPSAGAFWAEARAAIEASGLHPTAEPSSAAAPVEASPGESPAASSASARVSPAILAAGLALVLGASIAGGWLLHQGPPTRPATTSPVPDREVPLIPLAQPAPTPAAPRGGPGPPSSSGADAGYAAAAPASPTPNDSPVRGPRRPRKKGSDKGAADLLKI